MIYAATACAGLAVAAFGLAFIAWLSDIVARWIGWRD